MSIIIVAWRCFLQINFFYGMTMTIHTICVMTGVRANIKPLSELVAPTDGFRATRMYSQPIYLSIYGPSKIYLLIICKLSTFDVAWHSYRRFIQEYTVVLTHSDLWQHGMVDFYHFLHLIFILSHFHCNLYPQVECEWKPQWKKTNNI